MDMFDTTKFKWLKTLSPVAIATILFLAIELPARAGHRIYLPSRSHSSVRSYPIRGRSAPRSLNISPRTHIPLPRHSSRYYYYPSRDYYSDYDRYDRHRRVRRARTPRKGYRRVVIINPVLKY